MAKKTRSPFDVKLSEEQRTELTAWLCEEVQGAEDARAAMLPQIRYWHTLYEQGRTRSAQTMPWPDAADLTSPLATMYVDALHARAMRTIFTEPVCVVEGWGPSADRAPYVEAFHEWKQEEERLQLVIDKVLLNSWIDPAGVLEVSEATETRTTRKTIMAALELTPEGLLIFGEDGQPKLQLGPDGRYVEAQDEKQPAAKTVVDSRDPIRIGPSYQVIAYADYLTLPGHATSQDAVWGHAKRFWRRVPDLQRKAKAGIYDKEAVEALGTEGERQEDDPLRLGKGQTIATQDGRTAEKELWEVLFLYDFHDDGERWYVATVHVGKRLLLRVQHDDLGQSRYVRFVPFPRSDSVDGYSLVGHKLITHIESHTAWRNMTADRAAMMVNAPIKRVQGALWDPEEQPWGPKAIIDVRDPNEVQMVDVPDLTGPAMQQIQMEEAAAERVIGMNDIAIGVQPDRSDTLGRDQMVTGNSEVRTDTIIKRLQESVEQLYQIRHAIWKRSLAEQPQGIPAPKSVLIGLETKAPAVGEFDGTYTASLLEGEFRFKPRGSVQTADLARQRQDFVQGMQALANLGQQFPQFVMMMQRPEAARALFEQFIRVFAFQDRQAFLGGEMANLQNFQPPAPPMAPGMPGPPGQAPQVGLNGLPMAPQPPGVQ
jgi:hypothetical protein